MKSAIRFDVQYDVARLRADLSRASNWHEVYVPEYFDGDWNAVALTSNEGSEDAGSIQAGAGPYRATPLLRRCPYFLEILESFGCETERVRLMRLEAGSVVKEHLDLDTGWPAGVVRLHIPIVTSPDVHFFLDGVRLPMRAGELWYTNVMRPHAVRNEGSTARVHFVADLIVNENVRRLFPGETIGDRISRLRYRHPRGFEKLARYSGARLLDRALGLRRRRKRRRHARRARTELAVPRGVELP